MNTILNMVKGDLNKYIMKDNENINDIIEINLNDVDKYNWWYDYVSNLSNK